MAPKQKRGRRDPARAKVRKAVPRKAVPRKARFKVIKTGPITGPEPDWIHDMPVDNLVAGLTALSAEVYILRERLRAMERELARRSVLPAGAVEGHVPTAAEYEADQADVKAFVNRIWSELARGRAGWATIDPPVVKYFRQPA
jgi:hypothetical protein